MTSAMRPYHHRTGTPGQLSFTGRLQRAGIAGILATLLGVPPSGYTQTPASTGPDGAQIDILKLAEVFGLDGTGVRIGQVETGEPLETHVMLNGHVTRNHSGTTRDHATGVAGILIGREWVPDPAHPEFRLRGVAHGAELWSAGVDQPGGSFFNATNWLIGNHVRVINQSAGPNPPGVPDGASAETLFVDHIVRAHDVLWAQAMDNSGPLAGQMHTPEDAYNCISVGSVGATTAGANATDYWRVANYSARGPTSDPAGARHKPDIVAPGSLIPMPGSGGNTARYYTSTGIDQSGCSFAAPHVAGVAALLQQYALNNGLSTGHLLQKVTLMNGASKHVTDPANGNRAWVESPAATDPTIPLDDAMGIGRLNGLAAVRNYQPGYRSDVGLQSTAIGVGQTHQYDLFVGGETLKPGSLVTATLVWDRPVVLTAGADPSLPGSYTGTALSDLDLRLVRVSGPGAPVVVDSSISTRDNVEHIYFNVPTEGRYQLRVNNQTGNAVDQYALAWTSGTSDGLAFSVDGGAFNPGRPVGTANPAEGLMAPWNHPFPNDVNALGVDGPANFPTEGELFVSSTNGTNMQRLSGALGTRSRVGPHNAPPAAMTLLDTTGTQRGVLGLRPNDNVVGLSWGTDGTLSVPSTIVFSVDPLAVGKADSHVRRESIESPVGPAPQHPFPTNPGGGDPGNEAAGDIFKTPQLDRFGQYASNPLPPAPPGTNRQYLDEIALGLQAPRSRGTLGHGREDDLDALEMTNLRLAVDPDGDGLHNSNVFFNLDRCSPSVGSGGRGADDIFVSHTPFSFDIFANGVGDIDLTSNDALDGLILSDLFGDGILENGLDEALFSLDPTSPSGRPGDIYYTDFARPFDPDLRWDAGGSLFALADEIGLLATDNLDALDIFRIPEPATVLMAVGATALALGCGRQTRGAGSPRRNRRDCP